MHLQPGRASDYTLSMEESEYALNKIIIQNYRTNHEECLFAHGPAYTNLVCTNNA